MLKTSFQFIVSMLCQFYGWSNAKTLREGYVPLMYIVAIKGSIFIWVNIVSSCLKDSIEHDWNPKEGK